MRNESQAPAATLVNAGVVLGENYPYPLVEHKTISKENMGRMKQAYDDHKARVAAEAEMAKAAKKEASKKKSSSGNAQSVKKKQRIK